MVFFLAPLEFLFLALRLTDMSVKTGDLKQIKSSIYDFWMLNMVENNQAMTKKIIWSESFWNISLWKDFPLSEKKLTSLTINTKPFYINRQTYFGRESRALIWSPLSVDFSSKGCVGYRSLGPGFLFCFFYFYIFCFVLDTIHKFRVVELQI